MLARNSSESSLVAPEATQAQAAAPSAPKIVAVDEIEFAKMLNKGQT